MKKKKHMRTIDTTEIQKEMELMEKDVSRVLDSTSKNTEKLLKTDKDDWAFKGSIKCDICDSMHTTSDFEMIQKETCVPYQSAKIINQSVGFVPDYKMIEQLNLRMLTTHDPKEIAIITGEINRLQYKYPHLVFVCGNCAKEIQDSFKDAFSKIFNKKRNDSKDISKNMTTDLFNKKEVSLDERTALGTIQGDKI